MEKEAGAPYSFSGKFPADDRSGDAMTYRLHNHRHADDELQEYLNSK
jgi:hypothetical protein